MLFFFVHSLPASLCFFTNSFPCLVRDQMSFSLQILILLTLSLYLSFSLFLSLFSFFFYSSLHLFISFSAQISLSVFIAHSFFLSLFLSSSLPLFFSSSHSRFRTHSLQRNAASKTFSSNFFLLVDSFIRESVTQRKDSFFLVILDHDNGDTSFLSP